MTPFPPPKLQAKLAVIKIQEHRLSRIALWRSCLLVSCILSLGFLSVLPLWKIKDQDQIMLNGQKKVAPETVYNVLKFPYPQLIWVVDISSLTQKVESIPSVEAAGINRQILPPRLIISLQERVPVALAISKGRMGFLDVGGKWVAQEFYTNIEHNFNLPKLVVHNYQSRHQKSWITLYELISLYPELKIKEIQWNHLGNLFLQTKMGRVSLGTNPSRLEKQFEIMLKLQNLGDRININQIAYIDLSNPDVNLIQRY
jgi:cell division protein FtsQ